jgi:hypothetical protein
MGVAVLLSLSGCGMDDVVIPEYSGPAELALALGLTASPDVITADGFSTSSVVATARGTDGQPLVGQTILFALADEGGRFADIGTLSSTSGARLHAATATAVTGANGVAQVIYRAPARTDATANQSLVVSARPVGTDANAAVYRTVRIELKAAEPRLFPQAPGNAAPTCSFIIEPSIGEYHVRQVISFQTTATDGAAADGTRGTIVRYEWDFGDGTGTDSPDAGHFYSIPGTYTVVHGCTDDDGAQGTPFTVDITVVE